MRVKLGLAALVAFFVYRHRSSVGTAATDRTAHDPVSPELALVDSSLRDRLIQEGAVTEAESRQASSTEAAGVDVDGSRKSRRRSLVVLAVLLLTVAAVVGVGIALVRASHHDTSSPAVSTTATTAVGEAFARRDFAWAPVKEASRYDVQIRRKGEIIYSATTSVPHVRIPARWQRSGRTLVLSPGTYQWYVWPVVGAGARSRRGAAVVSTTFEIR